MDFALLRRRTAQVDEQHRAAMQTITEDLAEVHAGGDAAAVASRRRFLQRASTGAAIAIGGAVVPLGAMAAAAQTEGPPETADPDAPGGADPALTEGGETLAPGSAEVTAAELTREAGDGCTTEPVEMTAEDLQVVRFAESVERAAVAAYQLAIDGRQLIDPAVAESALIFQRHHGDHAEALYCLAGNEPAADGAEAVADQRMAPNSALVQALAPQIQAASDQAAVLELLYGLEEGAAATYLFALGVLETIDVAGAAGLILPVEGQHAVVWGQALGKPIQEWMPAFQTADGALDPAEYAS